MRENSKAGNEVGVGVVGIRRVARRRFNLNTMLLVMRIRMVKLGFLVKTRLFLWVNGINMEETMFYSLFASCFVGSVW